MREAVQTRNTLAIVPRRPVESNQRSEHWRRVLETGRSHPMNTQVKALVNTNLPLARRFRFVHVGVAALLAAAAATSVSLVQASGTGTASVYVPIAPCRLADTRAFPDTVGARSMKVRCCCCSCAYADADAGIVTVTAGRWHCDLSSCDRAG